MQQAAEGSSGARAWASALPPHLAGLINPDVLTDAWAMIEARSRDPHDCVRRRRCAEVIANHLLEIAEHV